MPYGLWGCAYGAAGGDTAGRARVGRPRRDRANVKAGRKAARRAR